MALTTATARREDDVTVVTAAGMLNMAAAPELRQAIHDALDPAPARIVVDLAGVDFIDSSGLGALIAGLRAARDAGGDLRISAPGPQVAMVLQLSNLDRVLISTPTAEAAYRD
ncbi:STAS domain-containing protein [Clavibacter michiganensis]|uniref:Anti-sigma factor antagonist n=2 Tax=Clavibacter michiganensis TaxID=28447 RepID=A0A251Y6R8_9MICO|nr:STAS domain-containing protein [Clavibacter michiganensis]AJW80090.1 anti-sigma factor antagonist [Clavibacter michiganensis subsp. insidiosus]AWF97255.1 anti-sigma factor antagonist [Clavibacter michiganensis subsp. insidiosus]AWG02658.1 anti-sigma factor antagonist [Clavibacter michiganensis subsp. insidiosus]OQJ58915.1 anti-anti-sigma factor [Clavibacter michiganensis subsp. insidiosus]OUE19992.1 Anti-sigma-B factor antagonist [Clavibacter michiganensis]